MEFKQKKKRVLNGSMKTKWDTPWYREIKRHLHDHPEVTLNLLNSLSMIPENMREAIVYLRGDATPIVDYDERLFFYEDQTRYLYAILEAFIRNHDYQSKDEWESAMQAEYNLLVESGIFPIRILKTFERALLAVQNRMVLHEIQEIKKYLCMETKLLQNDGPVEGLPYILCCINLKRHNNNNGPFTLDLLNKLTLVPVCWEQALRYFYGGEEGDSSFEEKCVPRCHNMKRDVLETFIDRNDFKRKATWERKMQAEYDLLVSCDILPPLLLKPFHAAVEALKTLSLTDIKTIKQNVLNRLIDSAYD